MRWLWYLIGAVSVMGVYEMDRAGWPTVAGTVLIAVTCVTAGVLDKRERQR